MITIFIRMKALPSKKKELLQTVESLVAETKNNSGCLNVCCYQDVTDENAFLMIEQWSGSKDAQTQLGSETFTVLKGAGTLMGEKPEIVIHTVEQSEKFIL